MREKDRFKEQTRNISGCGGDSLVRFPVKTPNKVWADRLLTSGLSCTTKRVLPPRWRCRLLGIWGWTDPRVWSPTGSEGESDTALWCCTRQGRRPWRRFREDEEEGGGRMLLLVSASAAEGDDGEDRDSCRGGLGSVRKITAEGRRDASVRVSRHSSRRGTVWCRGETCFLLMRSWVISLSLSLSLSQWGGQARIWCQIWYD